MFAHETVRRVDVEGGGGGVNYRLYLAPLSGPKMDFFPFDAKSIYYISIKNMAWSKKKKKRKIGSPGYF